MCHIWHILLYLFAICVSHCLTLSLHVACFIVISNSKTQIYMTFMFPSSLYVRLKWFSLNWRGKSSSLEFLQRVEFNYSNCNKNMIHPTIIKMLQYGEAFKSNSSLTIMDRKSVRKIKSWIIHFNLTNRINYCVQYLFCLGNIIHTIF